MRGQGEAFYLRVFSKTWHKISPASAYQNLTFHPFQGLTDSSFPTSCSQRYKPRLAPSTSNPMLSTCNFSYSLDSKYEKNQGLPLSVEKDPSGLCFCSSSCHFCQWQLSSHWCWILRSSSLKTWFWSAFDNISLSGCAQKVTHWEQSWKKVGT